MMRRQVIIRQAALLHGVCSTTCCCTGGRWPSTRRTLQPSPHWTALQRLCIVRCVWVCGEINNMRMLSCADGVTPRSPFFVCAIFPFSLIPVVLFVYFVRNNIYKYYLSVSGMPAKRQKAERLQARGWLFIAKDQRS